jgi:Ca-activated chloride channel family protein
MVEHDPLSTFATDADTASYDLFARLTDDGTLPGPSLVRLEDFVNYFSYDYPKAAADSELPFSIQLAGAPNPLHTGSSVLRVALQGKAAPEQQKKPANLTFLVDVSGSMQSADKLPLVQQVLRQTLDLLEPTDTVAIVSYASDTRVRLQPTPVAKRSSIVSEIERLSAGGSTAGASGIQLAYQQATSAFIPGGINHVILCTDGDFNVGPSSNEDLVALITRERKSGVTLTALGFGTDNLNDDMMEAVSNAGNGFYGYIGSESQAAAYVHERLLSTVSLIAKDVKVQVEFNPELVQAYRLLGYEDRAIADRDFRNDVLDAGEVGAEHRVTALYELVLAGESMPDVPGAPPPSAGSAYQGQREVQPGELVRVKLRYKGVDATESDPAAEVVSSLAPEAAGFAPADDDLAWAFGVASFAELLRHNPYASKDQLDTLDTIFSAQAGRDDDRADFYRLFRSARSRL